MFQFASSLLLCSAAMATLVPLLPNPNPSGNIIFVTNTADIWGNPPQGIFNNYGIVFNTGTINNWVGGQLFNFSGATIDNAGTFNNRSAIDNDGTIDNYYGAYFINLRDNVDIGTISGSGTIDNSGYFENSSHITMGTITNHTTGRIDNYGSIFSNFSNGTIDNYGVIGNYQSGYIENRAGITIRNYTTGIIYNSGDIMSYGNIDNLSGAYIVNYGRISSRYTVEISSSFQVKKGTNGSFISGT
jgi:hypothetical protein